MTLELAIATFNWKKTPVWLQAALVNARYLGGGASSHVWDLGNGYVVKLSKDEVVCEAMARLLKRPVDGLPKVWYVGHKQVNKGRSYYTVVIQTKYQRIGRKVWREIKQSMYQADAMFSRDTSSFNSQGRLACRQMWKLRRRVARSRAHPLRGMAAALRRVHTWLHASRHWAMDIDHSDNWGQDQWGRIVLIDPVV